MQSSHEQSRCGIATSADRNLRDARDEAFSIPTRVCCIHAAMLRAETLLDIGEYRDALRIVDECKAILASIESGASHE